MHATKLHEPKTVNKYVYILVCGPGKAVPNQASAPEGVSIADNANADTSSSRQAKVKPMNDPKEEKHKFNTKTVERLVDSVIDIIAHNSRL